ncbi:MMPL family transporter [Streptomyces montanisoli]|uniref:MMPL family transporter n=1 Tax=Streptomyces montanisoli TaxID=2798581 RepID=A0A940RTS9_9ACTN|nr:MMPL family transporter [Streptomyces montanisoli]MBP0456415.1 MMPL family transporter [Streptomyces montanisoli]
MASLLYRLGRFSFRRRRLVLSLWLAALAAVVAGFSLAGSSLDDQFSIPGSQSQQALDRLRAVEPAAGGVSGQIVFTAPPGHKVTERRYAAAIQETLHDAAHAPQVGAVISPKKAGTVTRDGRTALAQVQYAVTGPDVRPGSVDALEASTRPASDAGLTVHAGGAVFGSHGVQIGATEVIGVVVALVVLVITFGSLLAAGMPLLTAIGGLAVSLSGLMLLAHVFTISSTAITLAVMLGLAVGIDYTLFILSRHRTQLARGTDVEESAARALGTAGSAVAFAGLTVVVALAGLSVVGIPFLTVMGLSGAVTVVVAVLAATTLLPALLGFAGSRLTPKPHSRAARREKSPRPAMGARWIRATTRRPLLTVLAGVAALVVVAIPARELQLALPDNGSAPQGSTQREAYDAVSRAFGPGFNGPLLILADTSNAKGGGKGAKAELSKAASDLKKLPGVAAVTPPQPTSSKTDSVLQLVPTTAPDAKGTEDLVHRVRDYADGVRARSGVSLAVTGTTAVNVDVSSKLSASLVPFAAVVVGLCLIILLIVFRSIVVPVKATAGFLLSVAASFGAVVAVFQWGWLSDLIGVTRTGPVVSFLPVILMAVLFGLAMDYEVFVVAGIHEEYAHGRDPREAIRRGAPGAFRVVTAAALIMIAVFAGFVTLDDAIVKPIAFALAFGVLVDAFVVRLTLVPAVLSLVGRAGWWLPKWLARILPAVDIEGRGLPALPETAEGHRPHEESRGR